MTEVAVPAFIAATMGFVVFFLGAFLTRKVRFLGDYNIPEPVSGGLVIALVTWVFFVAADMQIVFDLQVRDYLLVLFFSTIGLNARISDLFRGGRLLLALLALTLVFMILQNLVGLLGVTLFGLPSSTSVLVGSASLIGGHGTAIAWGPQIEASSGFEAAAEMGVAAATLGLILAALLGGPIAKRLIDKHHLQSDQDEDAIVGLEYSDKENPEDTINHVTLMRGMLAAHIAILLGYVAHISLSEAGVKLPLFVPCLMVGILMSNTIPYLLPRVIWPARTRSLAVISDYALSVFLAMSLMSLQLWTLAELGGPILAILALQAIMTVGFILVVFFRLIGGTFQAAVLSAGFAGFTLGATPTAIANMSSVTKRYGPAPLAFIVLPLVSAFFVDLANALIIQFFVGL
ncbi:MAG: sodium/glutamate symporter [Pseudomonadota bacterium]